MHGYLRMRIAQFLTVIHPAPHTIYLSRHGQALPPAAILPPPTPRRRAELPSPAAPFRRALNAPL